MTHQGYVVRRAAESDVYALAGLRRAWTEEADGPVLDETFPGRFAAWYDVEASHRLTWLAESRAEAAGMLNLTVFSRMPRPGRSTQQWAYVSNLFVLAAHRNGGVGQLLLDAAIDEARSRGFVRLVLNPSERSVSFYERAGFGPSPLLQLDL